MRNITGLSGGLLALFAIARAEYHAYPRRAVVIRDVTYNTSAGISSASPSSTETGNTDPGYQPPIEKGTASTPMSTASLSSTPSSTTATTTPDQPICAGDVTYYDSPPVIVYETTTIGYDVTLTASSESIPGATLITPPPPCSATLMLSKSCYGAGCALNAPTDTPDNLYTSTVLVTKKTPVPTVIPGPTSTAPPNFHIPSPSTSHVAPTLSPIPQQVSNSPVPIQQSSSPVPVPHSNPSVSVPQSNGGSTSKAGGAEPLPITTAAGGGNNGGGNGEALPVPTTKVALGGSGFSDGGLTSAQGAARAPLPTSTNVNGVPVIVPSSGSSVAIGGQLVSIPPPGSSSEVVANGQTFTVKGSEIIGPSATVPIAVGGSALAPGAPTPVTAGRLTFSVGASSAIIDRSTYKIGSGAPTSTLTISGQTVIVGPSGVAVPGTTLVPAKVTGAVPRLSAVTAAGLTFSIGTSQVVVGGSTYKIGSGAPTETEVVSGKTISIGPSGVGLGSSVIPPATVPLSTVSADGLTFAVGPTEVVVGGSTYKIGSGAPTETEVINGKTVSIGPSGIGLASTTVAPEATGSNGQAQTGTAALSRARSACTLLALAFVFGMHLL